VCGGGARTCIVQLMYVCVCVCVEVPLHGCSVCVQAMLTVVFIMKQTLF